MFGVLIGVFFRYFWYFIVGVVFWGVYVLWGMNFWFFFFVMNGVSGLSIVIVMMIVLLGI